MLVTCLHYWRLGCGLLDQGLFKALALTPRNQNLNVNQGDAGVNGPVRGRQTLGRKMQNPPVLIGSLDTLGNPDPCVKKPSP